MVTLTGSSAAGSDIRHFHLLDHQASPCFPTIRIPEGAAQMSRVVNKQQTMLIRICTQLSTVQVQLLRLTRNGRSKGRYGLFAMAPWECSKFFSYSKIQLIQVLPISARPPTTRHSGNFQGSLPGFF
jgi:hypothetical protein